jgi:hypothetical protein
MTSPFAPVSCNCEIYPFEGGVYYLSSGLIESVTVSKSIRGGSNGVFSVQLAPGGPLGTESPVDWTQTFTPGSHVLIGMQRGGDEAIVLDGVVTGSHETQEWRSSINGSQASRVPIVAGADFCWFFNTQNWYSLAMYGLAAGTGLPGSLGVLPSNLIPFMSKGIVGNGSPVTIGQTWFNDVMAGASGMLGSTFLPYKGGDTRLPFNTLMTQLFEQYPGVYVPYTDQFLGMESWMSKFQEIFPHPWYEFFVTTAPSGVYSGFVPSPAGTVGTNITASGRAFNMAAFPKALPAGPCMVARVTPVPRFDFQRSASGIFAPTALDMTRWNALPLTALSGTGFYESDIKFSSDEVRNFYLLNPTSAQTLFGDNGSNNVPFMFIFAGAADPASVHRYGYQPANGTTRWLYDWNGTAAQRGTLDIVQTVATLTAALASWWHPLPLMAKAQVAIPLAPQIYPGTRYKYAPFKDGTPWMFYVETVTHKYVFGGGSMTILELTRGLPASIYDAGGAVGSLLHSIYIGNAKRQFLAGGSGIYQVGLPPGTGTGLQVFSTATNSAQIANQMTGGFVTPQTSSQ